EGQLASRSAPFGPLPQGANGASSCSAACSFPASSGVSMVDQVQTLGAEYVDLERQLADPAVHADQSKARSLGRRYAELGPIVSAYQRWQSLNEDVTAARELEGEDAAFAEEAQRINVERETVAKQLADLLVPRAPDDDRDVILEVKAGEGGDESALFAGDLLRMYLRYAERRGWKAE